MLPDLIAKFPWLAEFGPEGGASSSQGSQAEAGDATLPLSAPADAEEVFERAWADLEQKRVEWEVQGPVQGDAFTVDVVYWAGARAKQAASTIA